MSREGESRRLSAAGTFVGRLLLYGKEVWPLPGESDLHRFLWGQLLSTSGSWMTRIALGWLVFRLTGSAFWLGVTGFAGQIPIFVLAPLSGAIVDRCDRRHVLCVAYLLASVQALGLAGLAFAGRLDIESLIAMALIRGCISALELPARQAFLCRPREVGTCVSALAADSLIVNVGRLLGPSLAGPLIAFGGEASCFLFDGISYVAPILALMIRPAVGMRVSRGENAKGLFCGGWDWILRRKDVRITLLRLCFISLTGLPFTVLLPAYVRGVLAGGAEMLGWLVSMSSLGAIMASCLIGRQPEKICDSRQWPACLGTGGCLVLLGLSRWWALSLLGVFGASFFLMWQIVATNTALHLRIPEVARGRISAYCAIAFWGMAPFGSLFLGTAARLLAVPTVLCLTGLLCAGGALLPLYRLSDDARCAFIVGGGVRRLTG